MTPLSARSRKGARCLAPEIGVDRDGVGAEAVESVFGIADVGRADIRPLGIVDDGDVGGGLADIPHDVEQRLGTGRPESLEEGGVGLERAGEIRRGIDDGPTEAHDGGGTRGRVAGTVMRGLDGVGQLRPHGIEPDRHEKPAIPPRFDAMTKTPRRGPALKRRFAHGRTRQARISPAHIGTTVSPRPGTSTSAGMRQGSAAKVTVSRLSGWL